MSSPIKNEKVEIWNIELPVPSPSLMDSWKGKKRKVRPSSPTPRFSTTPIPIPPKKASPLTPRRVRKAVPEHSGLRSSQKTDKSARKQIPK